MGLLAGALQGLGAGVAQVGMESMKENAAEEAARAQALREMNLRMLMEDRQDKRESARSDRDLENKKAEVKFARELADEEVSQENKIGDKTVTKGQIKQQIKDNADAEETANTIKLRKKEAGSIDTGYEPPKIRNASAKEDNENYAVHKGMIKEAMDKVGASPEEISSMGKYKEVTNTKEQLAEAKIAQVAANAEVRVKLAEMKGASDKEIAAIWAQASEDKAKIYDESRKFIETMRSNDRRYATDNKPVTPAELKSQELEFDRRKAAAQRQAEKELGAKPAMFGKAEYNTKLQDRIDEIMSGGASGNPKTSAPAGKRDWLKYE